MVGEWGQAPILDKSESFVSVAVLKVFQRDIYPVRLNTPVRPIANEYREGKVKSTPRGE